MTIRISKADQVDALVSDLSSSRSPVRDAAVARLMVLGTRAVPRLLATAENRAALRVARAAALRALEGIGDLRGIEAAAQLVRDHDLELALCAIEVLRSALGGAHEVAAVDRLVAAALDVSIDPGVRESALEALRGLGAETVAPVLDVLGRDRQPTLRAAATRLRTRARAPREAPTDLIAAALHRGWQDDLEALRRAVHRAGASLPLPDLRQLIELSRERETVANEGEREAWVRVRAAAHTALARRGSRLAVFDLRETLETAPAALPVEFVAALAAVGDPSCLEPLAASWERANQGRRDAFWLRHVEDAFRAIATRERLTRRHAVLKRIEKRRPVAAAALIGPSRQ